MDMISNLPPPIIETILCFLPIQEAVRTSILSRNWRYHWTRIPKLVFTKDIGNGNDDENQEMRKFFDDINQVMSMRQGPIHEFSLSIYAPGFGFGPCIRINSIIDQLSRSNTVKKLTLDVKCLLPESLFSLHKLTDLNLICCRLDVPPAFGGFDRLASLSMENVYTTNKELLLFLSRCPSLKTVNLNCCLALLSGDDYSPIDELFECLPLVENLSIYFYVPEFVDSRNKLPTALSHLTYLCIIDAEMLLNLPSVFISIISSPNLEKLKLKVFLNPYLAVTWEDFSDIWLENLREIEIEITGRDYFRLDFMRLILAKSPVLKKVKILHSKKASTGEMWRISDFFVQTLCASPVVQIIVESGVDS